LKPIFDAVDTWSWFDGSTSAGYLITGPGTYSIAVQNACGTATDTAVISSLRAPDPVDLGPDTTLCPGESVTLTIDASTGNVQWPDGSGGSMFITADSGWVSVYISNVCGSVTDSLWVSIAPPLPALDLGPDQSICPGETILIDPGIAGVGYLWQDGSTGSQFQTAIPGNIILTISDACGSASDTLALVESNDPPMLVPGPDITACAGEQVILDAGISGVEYAWSTGESGSQIAVTASGVYVLSVENACGTDTDTVEVSFADPPPLQDLGPDRTLCEGEAIVLLAIPNGTDAVTWSDSSTFPQLIVDAAGTYSVSVTNACGTTSDSVAITYLAPPPDVALGPDTLLCPGDTLTLIAPDPAFDIAWQDGQAGSTYDVVVGGTYVLTLSNVCGTSEDSITVQFSETVPTLALPDQLALCPGESVILDATLPIQAEYNWNTGATTPSIAAEAPGQYWVEVTYPCGSVKDTIEIIRDEDCEADLAITFPNVFSPNGDGVNDVFTYSASTSSAVRALEGQIFDRWGNMVYRSTADPFVWDGRFQGDILNPGVFVYVIRLSILSAGNEEVRQFAGDVTVMR
jgi:gliding motility-associated-like protein